MNHQKTSFGDTELCPPTLEVQGQLPNVAYILEATAFERDMLYVQNRDSLDWQHGMATRILTLGHVDNRPVCINVSLSYLDGLGVLFVEPASELFDHKLLAAWLDRYCDPRREDGRDKARNDARHFQECLRTLRKLDAKKKQQSMTA